MPDAPDFSRSRALLMGTSEYSELTSVPAAAHSLRRMYQLLTGPHCGWPANRVERMHNRRTVGSLPDQLIDFYRTADDVALFYYVGHGQPDLYDQLCLGLVDSRTQPERRTTTSLTFEAVRHALSNSGAHTKIVILDCCFSGLAVTGHGALGEFDVLRAAQASGAYTVAASGEYNSAWYETDPGVLEPQTFFTKQLADIVDLGLPDQGDYLTLDVLVDRLIEDLAGAGKPRPTRRNRDSAAQFRFARNVASRAAGPAAAGRGRAPVAAGSLGVGADSTWSVRAQRLVGGRYRLLEEIGGHSGLARIWRARDEVLHADVAIKEWWLPPAASADQRAARAAHAEREARNAARLRHVPNVVTIYDLVVEGDSNWLVMQLAGGRPLSAAVAELGPLPVQATAGVAWSLLQALSGIHGAGLVHHDVAPANVLITAEGQVLLSGFGSDLEDEDSGTLLPDGGVIGHVAYMSPERVKGEVTTGSSDMFMLGSTLYHAVEGRSPFYRDTVYGAIFAIVNEQPPPPARAGRLAPLILRLLQKDPEERPTIPEALEMLRAQ